ncbi:hypothetical protein LTR86_007520 [Recurvomyces mirabilis]|nr:hypothetical protein LTR86_007520 [Recurvomyces mirabilis]
MPSSTQRIAVAGAGSLGVHVIRALVAASYPVTVLTRSSQPKSLDLPSDADVKYATVDYTSVSSLTKALHNHLGVVSTITSTATGEQNPLIEAAANAGVQRFLPAEFGSNMANPKTRALPVFGYKAATEDKLIETAKANPSFTYTMVRNGAFLDWGLEYDFLLKMKEHSITIFDQGEQPFSTTTLATVAKAVVGVFEHLKETKNRAVYVQDTVITQNVLLQMAKKASGTEDWKVERVTSEDWYQKAMAALGNSPSGEEVGKIMVDLLYPSIYTEGYGGDFSGKNDNELLGIKEMSREEVEKVVADAFA